MQFSTLLALAAATGTHFVLAEDAAHLPPIYPGKNHTGVPHNGSHPVFPTGTGHPTGIIGTGKPTGRPITKPITTSTSTCTDEEGEPTTTLTSVVLPTETDTVSGNLPFTSVSLPSGIQTQVASSNGGEFSTFTSLPGGYGAPSSAAGGYGKPSSVSSVPGVYGKPSSVASSLGSESSSVGGYGKPITPSGKPTGKPFPSGGFPIHTLNHTVPFPSGTGRLHPVSTGVSTHAHPTGTGIFTKSTNTPPVYGKPKPTPLSTYTKRSEDSSDLEAEDDCTTSSHIPKPTGTGFPHHFPSGSGVALPTGGHGHPSGVAHPSGHHEHPSGVAHPTNTRTKSFETRTKTKSAEESHSKTKEPGPIPTVY